MRVNWKNLAFWHFFFLKQLWDFFQAGCGLGRSSRQAKAAVFAFWAMAVELASVDDSEFSMKTSLSTLLESFNSICCQHLLLRNGITAVSVESGRIFPHYWSKDYFCWSWLVGWLVLLSLTAISWCRNPFSLPLIHSCLLLLNFIHVWMSLQCFLLAKFISEDIGKGPVPVILLCITSLLQTRKSQWNIRKCSLDSIMDEHNCAMSCTAWRVNMRHFFLYGKSAL